MRRFLFALLLLLLSACESAKLPVEAGMGPNPTLLPPTRTLIPTVHVVKAKGWREGQTPIAARGFAVNAFATGLDHPRWLYVLPNGDVLVAETNAPERPDDGKGIKGWFFRLFQKRAGAAVPSANRKRAGQSRRVAAVSDGGIEQQRRRERHRQGRESRRDPGGRSRHRAHAAVCLRSAQSGTSMRA